MLTIFGIVAIATGIGALVKGEIAWSKSKTLTGTTARLAAVGCILLGALILGAASWIGALASQK